MTWSPPSYADPAMFTEHDLNLDATGRTVPGTLTLPRQPADVGVVLLAGSGPFDRDGTTGPNKPLKDLAWGLATQGLAVLRFDKPTANRPEAMTEAGYTMTSEYVPPAVAAVHALAGHVDRVILVGHSMGGKVAPKVAAAEPLVDGVVILAGDTQPMQYAAVRVLRYLAQTSPEVVPPGTIELFQRQAAVVDSPGLSTNTPSAELPFGLPASFWLDLRAYDAVATAAKLDVPLLVLQGGRDYQVTVDDDLPAWRAGVPDATITVLDADNHYFFPGTGPSTMADYQVPGHMDPAVVAAIVSWLP